MPKIKDTDYLSISARVRAMERTLLTRERMERMLDARSDEEAVKILSECGYGDVSAASQADVERSLTGARDELYRDLQGAVPDKKLLDVFRVKHDYHNAKVLLKAEAMGAAPDRLLVSGGRYGTAALKEAYQKEDLREYAPVFQAAVAEAKAVLAAADDPQLADFVLDRAYYNELRELAAGVGSEFLEGYITLSIDAANLKSAVRAHRMQQCADFLKQVLVPGGSVPEQEIAAAGGEGLAALFSCTPLAEAAALGASLARPGGGLLTEFERMCDNALAGYVAGARRIPFGEQPVVGYLFAKEAELTAIRIILAGRRAGLERNVIEERLREVYV